MRGERLTPLLPSLIFNSCGNLASDAILISCNYIRIHMERLILGELQFNKLKCVSLRLNIILRRLGMSMKSLLLLPFIFFGFTANATNYYISSSSGNDANAGTSPGSAWQSLAKLNSTFNQFIPGDSILFKRGDTFYGSITISRSGASGSPITIGAYGTRSKTCHYRIYNCKCMDKYWE